MKWPEGPSTFRARVFWSVIPIVLLLLVCQGGISVLQHRRLVTEEFTRRARALTTNVAGSSELAVFAEDPALLDAALATVTGDPDVAYVLLYGGGGKLLTQGGRHVAELSDSVLALPPAEIVRLFATESREGRRISDGGRRFVEFPAPIVAQQATQTEELTSGLPGAGRPGRPKIVGGVRVGLSLERLEQQTRTILELWGGLAAIFVLVSTVMVYAFSRRITRPIKQLTGQAEKIARGDVDQRIPVESRDEIGTLAATFNDMARALKANIAEKEKALAELSDLNRTLEDRIVERTAELTDRTAALQRSLEEVRALAELSHAVSSSLDLHEVLQTVTEHAIRLSASDACGIFEIDPERHGFVDVATHRLSEDLVAALRDRSADAGRSLVESTMQAGHPVQIADVETAHEFPFRDLALREGFRALIAVPMGGRGTARSLVLCRRAPQRYDDRAVSLLTALANQSKIAIDNARLFREIEEKGRQLEIASRHKSQFLANMSHELRTPLNAILGYTELILDDIYGDVPEKIQEVLDRVQKSGRHLLSLINDVLDLSKIEAGQLLLALADYSIKDVVYSVFTATESLAAEKKLALNVGVPPDLPVGRGDERRIQQVLMNLVGNAIKFTDHGEVRVEVVLQDATFLVSVSDTGPGIAPADQAKLFQDFQQVDSSSTRKAGGTGLGLAIARRITEMHGGRIWVESAAGQGAIFRFTLPVRAEVGVPPAVTPTSPPASPVGAARATAP
jgi:signal transduction histidine kinase